VNGPICHGSGHGHKTTSDLVRKVEYVDANGVHQTVSDPALLRAAAGCFGLLGVVTHLTLELNAMTYAVMRPEKPDINLAIPPLRPQDVPMALQKTFTKEKIAEATKKFEERVENDYYNEFFWFPYQQKAWVNCWNDTPDPKGAKEYPPTWEVWLQWIQNWLGGVIVETKFFKDIPGRWQVCYIHGAPNGLLVRGGLLMELARIGRVYGNFDYGLLATAVFRSEGFRNKDSAPLCSPLQTRRKLDSLYPLPLPS
jgi:hypothetical protein